MSRSRFLAACAALAALPLLSSCIAAALPLVAASGILARQVRSRSQVVAALPAANAARSAAVEAALADGRMVVATGLTALPPPSGTDDEQAAWFDFESAALAGAERLAKGEVTTSALLTREAALSFQNQTRPCESREAAVAIDLDPGAGVFDPAAATRPEPALAALVAELRRAGLIVLWVSQASANEVAAVGGALQASGLDPLGRDPILLSRRADERKQVLREEANQTVCIVAMAGDRRSDFDELFDYLRDENLISAYDAQLGQSWFLVPALFAAADPSVVAPAGENSGR